MPPVDFEKLSADGPGEDSAAMRQRVNAARQIQQKRFEGRGISNNARMDAAMTREFCRPTPAAMVLLEQAFERLGMSARAYDKILRVARTVADLQASRAIDVPHIAQAIQFRSLDRKFWQN